MSLLQACKKPSVSVLPHPRVRQLWDKLLGETGSQLVEFAVILPILFLLVMGIITFGVAFWNQITLTNATNVAAQQAAFSRQQNAVDVCNPVNTALYNAGTGINNPSVANPFTFSITVNGSAINKNGTQTPISSNIVVKNGQVGACPVLLTQGQAIQVSTTYGCNLSFLGFKWPNCVLSASTQESIQ